MKPFVGTIKRVNPALPHLAPELTLRRRCSMSACGKKQTLRSGRVMSANDPNRTSRGVGTCPFYLDGSV
jgi:hypothetical protein